MKIRPIRTPEELDTVHKCAVADGHHLIWPTHSVEIHGNIVGAISIMPMVLTWMDTKQTKVRDSIQLKDFYEAFIAGQSRVVCVPCVETSPYFELLPKDGYINHGKINLFTKGL